MLRKPRRWTTRLRIKRKSLTKQEADPSRPFFMHPLIFLSGWVALGILFGFHSALDAFRFLDSLSPLLCRVTFRLSFPVVQLDELHRPHVPCMNESVHILRGGFPTCQSNVRARPYYQHTFDLRRLHRAVYTLAT
jgi:hypothetical protein